MNILTLSNASTLCQSMAMEMPQSRSSCISKIVSLYFPQLSEKTRLYKMILSDYEAQTIQLFDELPLINGESGISSNQRQAYNQLFQKVWPQPPNQTISSLMSMIIIEHFSQPNTLICQTIFEKYQTLTKELFKEYQRYVYILSDRMPTEDFINYSQRERDLDSSNNRSPEQRSRRIITPFTTEILTRTKTPTKEKVPNRKKVLKRDPPHKNDLLKKRYQSNRKN